MKRAEFIVKRISLYLATSLLIMLSVALVIPVLGQDVGNGGIGGRPAFPREDNPRSQSIFIHTLNPLESAEDGINIINNTEDEKTVVVYPTDFVNSSGGAFACEQKVETADEVGSWIQLEKDMVTLESAGTEIIPFTITVPASVDVGEHNGCLVVQEAIPDTNTEQGIGLNFRTAIRVAILVPGEINKQIELISLSTSQQNNEVILSPSIINTGNISVDTDISTKINTLWSSLVSEIGGEFPVLRDQTGEWNLRHEKPFWGGWYKTNVEAVYDESPDTFLGDETITENRLTLEGPVIFVWPQLLAGIIELLVLVGLIYGCYRLRKARKRRRAVQKDWKSHTVRSGEDIKFYAKATGVHWRTIAKANRIKAPYTLEIGQKIKLPPKKTKNKL